MQPLINSWSYKLAHRSLGLFLIRFATGMVFLMHGWMKVQNMDGVVGMFATNFGLSAWVAIFIAWLEIIGGLALIVGIFPRVFGLVFGIQMLMAIYLTGFFGNGYRQHELEIALALLSFGILFAGSGRFAVYSGECPRCGAYMCKMGPNNCPQMKA